MIEVEDCVPALHNPRHERFAQLVAAGQTPAEAYSTAGYGAKAAYTCGPRLRKRPEVQARILELRQTIEQTATSGAKYDREFVVSQLISNALRAKELRQFSASNRALELLGKELGMFVPVDLLEITSLDRLPPRILDLIIELLEKAVEEGERQKQLAAGATIDLKPEPVSS